MLAFMLTIAIIKSNYNGNNVKRAVQYFEQLKKYLNLKQFKVFLVFIFPNNNFKDHDFATEKETHIRNIFSSFVKDHVQRCISR